MNVKDLREQTKLSQADFAKATGISVYTIRHWEQGYSKPPEYMLPILEKSLKYDKLIPRK